MDAYGGLNNGANTFSPVLLDDYKEQITYDAIGNLIKDDKEDILNIDWTVYGKITQIRKRGGILINYKYDAAGNRIFKSEGGR